MPQSKPARRSNRQGSSFDNVLLGFGLGYQVASAVDLTWMLLAPRVNAGADEVRAFGADFGVQFRIGE